MTINVRVRVDADAVIRQMIALLNDVDSSKTLRVAESKIEQLQETIAQLNLKLQTPQKRNAATLTAVQESRKQALNQVDAHTLVMRASVAIRGTEAEGAYLIGKVSNERLTEARQYLEQALRIDPDNGDALSSLAGIFVSGKRSASTTQSGNFIRWVHGKSKLQIKRGPGKGAAGDGRAVRA